MAIFCSSNIYCKIYTVPAQSIATLQMVKYNASVPLQQQCVVLAMYVKVMLKMTQIILKVLSIPKCWVTSSLQVQ